MMKNSMLYFLLLCLLSGCSEVEYKMFSDVFRVQMKETKDIRYDFFYQDRETVSQDTVFLPVQILGGPIPGTYRLALRQIAEYDVEYLYDDKGNLIDSVKTEKPDKAEAGVHYVAMDAEEMEPLLVVRQGSVTVSIPVILLRDISLRTKEMRLCLELVVTSDFQLGERGLLSRTILFSDKLSRPEYWDEKYEEYYFGDYSERKHEFMQEVAEEIIDNNWYYRVMMDYSELTYMKRKFKNALEKYNADRGNLESGLAPMRENPDDPKSPLISFPD